MDSTPICIHCAHPIQSDYHYCPGCGKMLTQQILSTSVAKQLLIYTVSFCLAPFGLRWVWPYFHQKSRKAKMIGMVALLLTITSLTLTIISVSTFMNYYAQLLDSYSSGKALKELQFP